MQPLDSDGANGNASKQGQGDGVCCFHGSSPLNYNLGFALVSVRRERCYRIQSGLVKVMVASQQGEERIISLLGPSAIVGELSMIDGRPRSASVVAIADCSLSFVSRAKFQKYTEAHPELTTYLVKTLAGRLREADEALAAATFLSVKARLARALLNIAEYVGEDNAAGEIQLRLKISQSDLAAMAGVARENVSRTMSEWRKREIVTRSSSYYCINDPAALAQEMASDS